MQQAINIPNDAHNHDYMCASDEPGIPERNLKHLDFSSVFLPYLRNF